MPFWTAVVNLAGTGGAFAALAVVTGDMTQAATGAIVVAVFLFGAQAVPLVRPSPFAVPGIRRGRAQRRACEPITTSGGDADRPLSPVDEQAGGGSQGAFAADPAAFGQPGKIAGKLGALGDYMEKLPEFCDILKEHANNVIQDTEQASYALVDNLQDIDSKIKDLKDLVVSSQTDISSMDKGSKKNLEENFKIIAEINSSFEQNTALTHFILDERKAFSHVVATMRRLQDEVRVIDDIARRIKLLSLNASLEAARAAQFGAGFAVIAKEIRCLSDQTQEATHTLSPLIETACGSVEHFAADPSVEGRLRTQLDLLNSMQAHLRVVTESGSQMHEHERALTTHLTTHTEVHSAGIEDAICRTLAALQFQDIVRQQLEGVIAALDDLHGTIRNTVECIENPDEHTLPDPEAIAELIGRLRAGYVMSRQRSAHAKVTGTGTGTEPGIIAAGSGPAIELF